MDQSQALRFFNNLDLAGNKPRNVMRFLQGYIEDPLSNEPTYLTFDLYFNTDNPFNDELGMFMNPLFSDTGKNNAENYLRSYGNPAFVGRFKSFKTIHRKIFGQFDNDSQSNFEGMPWMIQSIDGIPAMWKAGIANLATGNKAKDVVIKFETLESLNLNVTAMASYYRNSAYDLKFMREVIPRNLRYFKFSIYVAEFRNLYTLAEKYHDKDELGYDPAKISETNIEGKYNIRTKVRDDDEKISYFQNYASVIKFDCSLCEFDFSETVGVESVIGVHSPNMSKNKFAIKVGWFEEDSSFMNEAAIRQVKERSFDPEPQGEAEKRRNVLQRLAQRAKDAAQGMWKSSATRSAGASAINAFSQATNTTRSRDTSDPLYD